MRGTVAKRLRRMCLAQLEADGAASQPSVLETVEVKRGSSRMRKLKLQRKTEIEAAVSSRGRRIRITLEMAKLLIPPPSPTALQLRCTGPRAMYLDLKRQYKEKNK